MRTERERREHAISGYASAAVRLGLGVALFLAAAQAFRAIQTHAGETSLALRLVLPVLFSIAGLAALRSGWRFVTQTRALLAEPLATDDDEDDAPGVPPTDP